MPDLKPITVEPIRPIQTRNPSALQRARFLGNLLDNSIPLLGGYRIGLDPFLGLVPGLGDLVGAALSGYIVWVGANLGLPRITLSRMVFNILIEALFGLLPILGDIFDATWKSNQRNLNLIEAHLSQPQAARTADRAFVIGLLVLTGLVVVGITGGFIFLLSTLWHLALGS